MCGSSPSPPPPPPPPPAPPPAPTPADEKVTQAQETARQQAALAVGGRQSTILTSGLGLSGETGNVGRKSLLGS